MAFTIKINGKTHSVDVDGDTPLLWVLRDVLGMTGTKFGCGKALCGACTVHIDGTATRSCVTTVDSMQGPRSRPSRRSARRRPAPRSRRPGSTGGRAVRLLPVRPDHVRSGAARAQRRSRPTPTSTTAMSGNICRCGTYGRIREAIKQAAQSNDREAAMILDRIASRRNFLRAGAAAGGG